MLAKDVFEVRDMVNVKPYKDVEDHYGIPRNVWDNFYENNPHQIIEFSFRGSAILNFDNSWAWLASALELSYEKNMPDIMDMV